jgi:hypothetical protein
MVAKPCLLALQLFHNSHKFGFLLKEKQKKADNYFYMILIGLKRSMLPRCPMHYYLLSQGIVRHPIFNYLSSLWTFLSLIRTSTRICSA